MDLEGLDELKVGVGFSLSFCFVLFTVHMKLDLSIWGRPNYFRACQHCTIIFLDCFSIAYHFQ